MESITLVILELSISIFLLTLTGLMISCSIAESKRIKKEEFIVQSECMSGDDVAKLKEEFNKPEKIEVLKPKEEQSKRNEIVVKEQKQKEINPRHLPTQEQLDIMIKLSGQDLKEEQIKIYFSKATNTLIYRYRESCVKKEYHGANFLNYTLLKHNRVVRVLYKEDLKEFDKAVFKQNKTEENKDIGIVDYEEKVKDFMNLKRSTMLPDDNILKKIGISKMMLDRYIKEKDLEELKELRRKCQAIGIAKIKQRGVKGV